MTLKKPLLGEDDNSPFPLFGALGALGGIIGRRKRRRKGENSGALRRMWETRPWLPF